VLNLKYATYANGIMVCTDYCTVKLSYWKHVAVVFKALLWCFKWCMYFIIICFGWGTVWEIFLADGKW